MKPDQKLSYIEDNKAGEIMMLGDGLNDGLALKSAKLGLAITENELSFIPGGDIIVKSRNLTSLPMVLKMTKVTKYVLFSAFGISILYNIVGLFYAITGRLTPLVSAVLMPLSSISVVLFIGIIMFFLKKNILN